MKTNRGLNVVLVLFLLLCSLRAAIGTEDYVDLTITVEDVYGTPIDDARVSVDYLYPRTEDEPILDQFTRKGMVVFTLESEREYLVTITKAGFVPHTETVDLTEETEVNVILEYTQNMPVLQLKRYTVTPPEVGPGEHFELQLVIENRGTGDALSVKVSPVPAQVFSPVQPQSSAFLERLDKGKVTSVFLTFAVTGEAPSGVYDLAVTIVYQDALSVPHTATETVGIPILRKPLIKLLNVEYPPEVEKNTAFTFSVEVANTGRFSVNGLYVEVESDMDWEYFSYYIGSLEAGDFDTFTSQVTAASPGEHTFTIQVGYVDDFNREHTQEESFSVTVTERVQETPAPQEKGLWERLVEFLKAFFGWE